MSPITAVLEYYGFSSLPHCETGWRPIKCAFHDDKHASASINTKINGFRCHACDISGDAISIVRDREGIGYEEAIRFIQGLAGGDDQSLRAGYEPRGNGLPGITGHHRKRRAGVPAGNRGLLGR